MGTASYTPGIENVERDETYSLIASDKVEGTINGIGERAGNCNLEHLLIATQGQLDFGISLDELQWRQADLKAIIYKNNLAYA